MVHYPHGGKTAVEGADHLTLRIDILRPARTPSQLLHPDPHRPDDRPAVAFADYLAGITDALGLTRSGALRTPGVQVDHAGRLLPDEGVVIVIGDHAPTRHLARRVDGMGRADATAQGAEIHDLICRGPENSVVDSGELRVTL